MRWEKKSDKISAVQFYQKMGFSCSLIEGNDDEMNSYKNLSLESTININEQDLETYTGLGIHLGKNNEIRAIDIDDFHIQVRDDSYDSGSLHSYAISFFVKKCLLLLGLPEDYEWIIKTPHGWHIIISAPSFGFNKAAYLAKKELKPDVRSGNVIQLNRIELLWEGFLVMPPSKYGKYDRYYFYNQQPQNLPIRVGAAHLLDFICFYCGEFEYITDLTTQCGVPIIGDAHLFPHYTLNWDYGSEYYEKYSKIEDLSKNTVFLKMCRNPLGFNMLGFRLVFNDIIQNYKVEKELNTAIKCFRMANDEWGHYNLACLMAIGAMDGSIDVFYKHLELSQGFPDNYKDQLILLYLAKNHTYEKYTIIDIGINENHRLEKIAILIVDAKGNILDRRFILSDSVMMQNMYYALESADYIVGCDLVAIEDAVRSECEICGYSFSEDYVGFSSDEGEFTEHSEGHYLDVFCRPQINLSSIQGDEIDPFRRIYKIKDLFVKKLNERKNL